MWSAFVQRASILSTFSTRKLILLDDKIYTWFGAPQQPKQRGKRASTTYLPLPREDITIPKRVTPWSQGENTLYMSSSGHTRGRLLNAGHGVPLVRALM